MWRTPAAAAAPSAARPALRAATSASPPRSAAGARRPRRGRRSGGGRGRRGCVQAGVTSTKRNSAARSSWSWAAISIALTSSASQRVARRRGERGVDRAADSLQLGLHRARTICSRSVPDLILGPLLRYVGETEARHLGRDRRALRGRGARHARAHVQRRGPPLRARLLRRPRAGHLARVRGRASTASASGRRRTGFPPSAFRTYPKDAPLEIVFGSCRVAVPHEPPYSLRKDEDERGREIDALHTLAQRMRDAAARASGRTCC